MAAGDGCTACFLMPTMGRSRDALPIRRHVVSLVLLGIERPAGGARGLAGGPSSSWRPLPVIGFFFRARFVTAAATAIVLVLLVLFGKKVSYEQSIGSFFAEDDPYMAVYEKAARSFGDDNFVFLVYDDPELVSPQGLDRVSELAAAVAPGRIPGVSRVESLDAMPLVWSLDDVLIALDRLPAPLRKAALSTAKRTIQNIDLKTNAMTVSGAVRTADEQQR